MMTGGELPPLVDISGMATGAGSGIGAGCTVVVATWGVQLTGRATRRRTILLRFTGAWCAFGPLIECTTAGRGDSAT